MFYRIGLLAVVALLTASGWAGRAIAQYPTRPVTIVVSGPAGGPLDVVTRKVFEKVEQRLAGQAFVIDNKAGAGGVLAVTSVTRGRADGYTLLSTIDAPIVATPTLQSVPYDPLKDLMPVAMLGDGGDNVLLVPQTSSAKSVQELITQLRTQPDQANYSSSGNGGPGHLLGELFNRQANTRATHIPHKGATEALNALLAGRVSFGFVPVGLAVPFVQSGKVRALAVASNERNPLLPDLPTVEQAGVQGFNPVHWWIIAFAPTGTPPEIVQKLNAEIRQATQSPEIVELLRKQALRPSQDPPEKVAERVKNDVDYWSRLIKAFGITSG